jgi:flavin reductase (DIM6/NTAB) family NADH-FMN oxidoreductase RutF
MFYSTAEDNHGLKFNPFKALIVPRPIGWIASVSKSGVPNLAPYSFFNAMSDTPPVVCFASGGHKDSLDNIEATGEFTCSMSNWDLRDHMNMSSAPVAAEVDEFKLAGLTPAASKLIKAPWVAESPAAFECKLWKIVEMPSVPGRTPYIVVFGTVVGVHVEDEFIRDGLVDTAGMRPLARMGYMDYAVITPETSFTLNRPTASADKLSATVVPGPWDGVYR